MAADDDRPDPRGLGVDPSHTQNIRSTVDPSRSRSLEYGLAMLECFSAGPPTLGIADMADLLGMNRSTTHRYALTLVSLGFLEQDRSRKYRLAAGAADIGLSALATIAARAGSLPVLEELREQTGHTASLGMLDGARAIYVQRAHGHRRGQYRADLDLRSGAQLPLHCTAIGKAMLASQSPERQDELLADMQLTRHGPNTITTKDALSRQLALIGAKGLAVCDEEQAVGVRSVALAVRDPTERNTLAVEVTVPAADHTPGQLERCIGPAVRAAARQISMCLRT